MLRATILGVLLGWTSLVQAQQFVTFKAANSTSDTSTMSAALTLSKASASPDTKKAAVVLLHSAGGWEWDVTSQYAKALGDAGFIVLEPRMFASASNTPAPLTLMPWVYGALQYLASRDDVDPKRIGVAGFSLGGLLALHSAASWTQQTYAGQANLKFAAHAPFYPICWGFLAVSQGKRRPPALPVNAFSTWTGVPVKIFAGGKDDYDGRDPAVCGQFVASLPAEFQKSFSVQVYPDATHGWDQKSASFHESFACKGSGCTVRNESNPTITAQSIADVVAFFKMALQ